MKTLKELLRQRSKSGMFTVTYYENNQEWYCDDMSGEQLDSELVKKARQDEMKYFKEYGVYIKVHERECFWGQDRKGTNRNKVD